MYINMEEVERLIKAQKSPDEAKALLQPIKELAMQRRYGLIWEEPKSGAYEEEHVESELLEHFPFLEELTNRAIIKDEEAPSNLLIEGDNLHALQAMQYTHKGKVDVIYVDPPYNTGKEDFVYNDRFVEKEDSWRHSSWLSFMNKRLRLAKKLLSQEGVIFLSIDDNEFAQLKLLCDQIFGEHNFIGNLPRIVKKGGKTTASIAKNHDYVLIYVNNNQDIFQGVPHFDKDYKHKDKHFDKRGPYKLNQTLDYDSLKYSESMDYPLEHNGKIYYPGGDKSAQERRLKGEHNKFDWTWRWSPELFEWGVENDWIVVSKTDRIYTKTYLNAKIEKDTDGNYQEVYHERTKPLFSVDLVEGKYSNDNGKKNLYNLNLDYAFEFPKPVELIKTLTRLHKNKDALVLDFFAGSGTTGHAVMDLNNEDGGNRQFILCTNNEVSKDKEKNALVRLEHVEAFNGSKKTKEYKNWLAEVDAFKETEAYQDFVVSDAYQSLGISRAVTYERIKRVIEGYTTPKEKEVAGLPNNFRHFLVSLKEDYEDEEYNSYKLIGDTVDLIRLKENLFHHMESASVNELPVVKLLSEDKVVYVVLSTDVIDADIEALLDTYPNDDRERVLYTNYTAYPYANIRFEELPKEILRALKMKEMK